MSLSRTFSDGFNLCVLLQMIIVTSEAISVTLYEHIEYQGRSVQMDINRCTNIHRDLNDWASSVKTSSCIILYEDDCCQGRPLQLPSDNSNFVPLNFNDKLTSMSPCGNFRSSYPSSMKETWLGHNQTVSKVFENGDIAFYYNQDMRRDVTWPRDYLRKLWTYTKRTYGSFGPEGGRLHPVFHANVEGSQYGFNSLQNYFDRNSDCRNLIDVVGGGNNAWTRGPTGVDLDVITHEVSHIVEGASKGIHGSPTYHLWGDSKWAEIFIYDVYSSLGYNQERDRWFNEMQKSIDTFPKPNTQWFKNWFYPVYTNYGRTALLNNYFTLLSQHFPKKPNGWEYVDRFINMGEFVHFFSGAARANLKNQANFSFSWDNQYEGQWRRARQDFPGVGTLYRL